MRKTDKKIDNQIRIALTNVCDKALIEIDGFQWLTHLVNYSNFPNSLKVICVFNTNESLSAFLEKGNGDHLMALVHENLTDIGVNVKDITAHVLYDTEENCEKEHNGKWAERWGKY
ncbi:MAG: hypothetical protein COB30_006125 [Ectothiorhodospiraceae bacterium]|nr:hypothetical protein [Ectothiorhodospiraceae bacterium]